MRDPARPANWPSLILIYLQIVSLSSSRTSLVVAVSGTNLMSNDASLLIESQADRTNSNDDSTRPSNVTKALNLTEEDRFRRRSKSSNVLPEFSTPIGNVTAVLGRDVRLVCTVENLGSYQVAWLKEETKTIISIDTNIIITNYRIFLIPDEEERKWVLHIKDVQESDRGYYQCQVNTNPMRSSSGYLEVVVPPTIIESQTTQVAEVVERSNVTIQCKANGHPKPGLVWRRDDGSPIKLRGRFASGTPPAGDSLSGNSEITGKLADNSLNLPQLADVRSDRLALYDVDRSMAGIYVCLASNGIPTDDSRRIPVYVKFPPKTSVQNKHVPVNLGDQLVLECLIEAFPKPNSYWSKSSSVSISKQVGHRADMIRSAQSHRIPPTFEAGGAILASQIMLPNSSLPTFESNSHQNPILGSKQQPDNNNQQSQLSVMLKHPHNRIQFIVDDIDNQHRSRQKNGFVDVSRATTMIGRSYRTQQTIGDSDRHQQSAAAAAANSSEQATKAYVAVKQTAVNPYTYKLKLTIDRMQPDDYGKYTCVATNPLGTYQSTVMVTKTDSMSERTLHTHLHQTSSQNPDYRSLDESEYQRDSLNEQQQQQQFGSRRSPGNKVVYDENYLQAIKTRQSNVVGTSRLQQKPKSKVKNSATQISHGKPLSPTILAIATTIMVLVAAPIHGRL